MIRRGLAAVTVMLAVVSCTSSRQPADIRSGTPSPYQPGKKQSEPVFYNGKHYDVSFTYNQTLNAYDMTVTGDGGRKLGSTPGDQQVVEQIASSTVRHFACPNGQKGYVLAGSSRYDSGAWALQATCR
ncbi:MAG: hypothetical protein U1E46_16580 [Hyphomicrobiales bacterium]